MSPAAQLSILLTLKDLASGPLASFGQTLQQTSTKLIAMGEASRLVGQQMMGVMRGPITAFAEAEDAATRLKTAMMDGSGRVAAEFERVNALAVSLGNRLPGTTKDFQNMMTVLVDQGVSYQAILDGIGESAAYLAVGLKMPFDEAARFAARMSKATGVAEADMLAFIDTLSRAAGLGVSVSELEYAFGRSAGKLKELGLQGLQASRDLAPLYAILINAGLSGETVGTGFASILSSIQDFAFGLSKNAIEARQRLEQLGVSLRFLDERGRARGVEAIVSELEKLKNLAPEVRASVIRDIFGTGQDAQMVATMIEGGVDAYRKMAGALANKAALQEKVNAQLGTLKNLWDAATGTLENAAAAFAGALAPELKRATEWLNGMAESLQGFIKEYPLLAKLVGGTLLFGGALAVAGGTVAMLAGVAMKAAGGLAMMARWLGINRALAAGGWALRMATEIANSGAPMKAMLWHLQGIAAQAAASSAAVGGRLVGALRMAGQAVMWLGRAVMLNPIGMAIAAAALLIYKYWGPVSGFFKGLWNGLKAGLAPVINAFRAAFEPIAPIFRPIGEAIGRLAGLIGNLFNPMEDAGRAAERLGERVGLAIGRAVEWIMSLPRKIMALPGMMLDIGAQIAQGLINGIKSKLAAAGEAIKGLGQSVVSGLKGLLGIRSPSRVFAELGGFVAEGFAGGIGAGLSEVRKAASALSAAAMIALPAPALPAVPDALRTIRQAVEPVALPAVPDALRTIRQAVEPVALPAAPALALPALPATRPAALAASGGGMTVTFAPVIHVAPGQPSAVREQVSDAMRMSFEEFERLMRRYEHAVRRRSAS